MGVFWLLVLSYMLFELFLKRWYRRWRHREQILRALRALDRCGSCGYELKGIGVQEDGCQVCPECGAAWRADKVRSEGEPRWVRPKPWHRKYVHDDRGWRCRPYFGVRASLLGRGMKRRRLLLARSGPLGWVSYSLGYLVLVVLVAGIASAYLTEEWIILLWVMGFAFAGLVTQAILWPVAWWVRCEPMRLALLERGMCVCCHSALPGEAEPDGRRVCALCGSAWLTPRDSTGE